MEKSNKAVLQRLSALALSLVLVLSMSMPVAAFADDRAASVGEQTGSGTTALTMVVQTDPNNDYGGTDEPPYVDKDGNPTEEPTDPDTGEPNKPNPATNPEDDDGLGKNLKFTVPTSINFVLNTDGTLIGPTNGYIENRSNAIALHASALKVTEEDGWDIVEDATASLDNDNIVDLSMAPKESLASEPGTFENLNSFVGDERVALNHPTEWNTAAKARKMLAFDGHAQNVKKDATVAQKFGEIHWYVKNGEAPTVATQIARALQSGDADKIKAVQESYYNGDYEGEDLSALVNTEFDIDGIGTVVVTDTGNYSLADDSGKKAMITWQAKDCTLAHDMNSTFTNEGGWDASELRTYLNGAYKDSLNSDVQGLLKQVNVIAAKGPGTTTETSKDYLFIPSEKEVSGTNTLPDAATAESALSQWEYYKTESNRCKSTGTLIEDAMMANIWWLRTPHGGTPDEPDTASFMDAMPDGSIERYGLGSAEITGVAPCGCF